MRDLMADRPLDLVVKNVRVVRPTIPEVETRDVGVKDGRIVRVAPEIAVADAQRAYDGRGRLAFPGVVDGHTHVGIYGPLAEDAVRESRAAVSGGVTTMLTYFRTGQYYLRSPPVTSTRWRRSRRRTACRRSRSSCSVDHQTGPPWWS